MPRTSAFDGAGTQLNASFIRVKRRPYRGRLFRCTKKQALLLQSLFCGVDLFGSFLGKKEVDQDAEDQSAGDGGNGDLTEGDGQTANAGDENDRCSEEVAVFFEVDFLEHL